MQKWMCKSKRLMWSPFSRKWKCQNSAYTEILAEILLSHPSHFSNCLIVWDTIYTCFRNRTVLVITCVNMCERRKWHESISIIPLMLIQQLVAWRFLYSLISFNLFYLPRTSIIKQFILLIESLVEINENIKRWSGPPQLKILIGMDQHFV